MAATRIVTNLNMGGKCYVPKGCPPLEAVFNAEIPSAPVHRDGES